MKQKFWLFGPALVLAFLVTTVALAQSGGTYDVSWHTFDGGGTTFSTSGPYSLGGTAGQPDAGALMGGTYALTGGFWQALASSPTDIELVSFGARATSAQIQLKWRTASERSTIGYNVWRAVDDSAQTYAQINPALLPPKLPGIAKLLRHVYFDVPAAGAYLYKIEIVKSDTDSEWSKPVNVTMAEACATKPTAFQATAPADQSELTSPQVVLKWQPASCATTYQVTVRRESQKGHVALKEQNLMATQYKTHALRPANTYFWQVRACNSVGCANSGWSSFTIKP